MGGRGARLGVYQWRKRQHLYGDEYHSVYQFGNIKFIQINEGSIVAPLETMTKGRVYVTVNKDKNQLSSITYFDNKNKRVKQIDLTHEHNGLKPHTHHGYIHNENDGAVGAVKLTDKEEKMVARVKRLWNNKAVKSK